MRSKTVQRPGTRGGMALGLLLAVAAAALTAGCAAQPEAGEMVQMATASDDSEPRRRARIRLELAVGYFEQGKTEIALDELKQVIATDPTLPDAYNLRGLAYMRLNDFRLAEDSFKRSLALNSRDSNTLHNYGWLQCQAGRYEESFRTLELAMVNPLYADRAKTYMALGVCQARSGRMAEAERSLGRAYELDAANPITGYNLANLLYRRGEFPRAQFYIRRLNNSELANAESLWLGIKVERRMNDREAMLQLGDVLRRRYPQSAERRSLDKGSFDE